MGEGVQGLRSLFKIGVLWAEMRAITFSVAVRKMPMI